MAHLREETLNTYLALLLDSYEGITAIAERRSSTEAIDITVVHGTAVAPIPILVEAKIGNKLRPGNVHSAEDWDELLLPEIERQQAAGKQVAFRGDAAFAKPEVYEASEERGVQYAIRIPANKSLELEIEDILFRPPGRPSRKPLVRYKSFRYQAESWSQARRIVAKVEHHQGELFPRVGFIVTSMSLPSRSVVRFYNKRGTAEQWIKEGKQATHWTRLSCHRFRANEVRLQLRVLAYNLGNLWWRLGLPNRIKSWSLTSLQHRLMKTRRSAGQARAVLLAAAGRRAFEPQAVRRHAAQDLGAAAAKRVALTGRGSTVFGSKRFRKEQCRPERRSARSINVCERMDEPWRLPAEVMCRVQREKTWYSGQRGCILSPCQGQNGNPGLENGVVRCRLDDELQAGGQPLVRRRIVV